MADRISFATLALCLAAQAVPALASSPAGTGDVIKSSQVVRYSIAELHSAQGARALAMRIDRAATSVCGGDNVMVPKGPDYLSCHKAAIDHALAKLNAPLVSSALCRLARGGPAERCAPPLLLDEYARS